MNATRIFTCLRPASILAAVALVLLGLVAVARAEGPASGSSIKAAISGNTFKGRLEGSGSFEEFYAANGTIQGPDYSGQWNIQGDLLCLAYDGDPASCWGVRLEGSTMIWIGASGAEGSGVILSGNPNGY